MEMPRRSQREGPEQSRDGVGGRNGPGGGEKGGGRRELGRLNGQNRLQRYNPCAGGAGES